MAKVLEFQLQHQSFIDWSQKEKEEMIILTGALSSGSALSNFCVVSDSQQVSVHAQGRALRSQILRQSLHMPRSGLRARHIVDAWEKKKNQLDK